MDEVQAAGLAYLQEARQFSRLGGVDQGHWALLTKMKGTEEFHWSHCVGFAKWNWAGKGIEDLVVKEDAVATNVRMRVVSGPFFTQQERMYLKMMNWLSPEGFGRASSCLNSP